MSTDRAVHWLLIAGRIMGWVLIAAALVLLGAQLVEWLEAGTYRVLALGEVWYRLDSGSLNLAQAVVQRYLHPALWDPVLITVLQWPGWLTAGVPGALLVVLYHRLGRGGDFLSWPRWSS